MRTATTLEIVPSVGRDPKWNRARELLAAGRKTAIALRDELEQLRATYLRQGQGARTDLRDTGVTKVDEQGFQAAVERELGISYRSAYRLMERSDYQDRIERVACAEVGEVVSYEEKGEAKKLEVTPARQALARKAVASWALPQSPKPSRAWAGICGEGSRIDDLGAGNKDRAEPDHLELLLKAAATIRRIGPRWEKLLRPAARARVINELGAALAELPQHVRDAIVEAAAADAAFRP